MTTVTIELARLSKRFARTQASAASGMEGDPVGLTFGGGDRLVTADAPPYRSASAMRRLYQFMNAEVDRLVVR
jgi:hypothetical protein